MELVELQRIWANRGRTMPQVVTAINQHERMLFYFTFTGKDPISDTARDSYTHFAKVAKILDSTDKYKRYCQMFSNPIPEMLSLILPELSAANNAIDRFISVEFASKTSQEGFEIYINKSEQGKRVATFFNQEAIYTTFINPSAVLIVETDENGNPYMWVCDLRAVRGFLLNSSGNFEMLAVANANGTISVFCSEYYRVFDDKDVKLNSPISEIAHGIGYCPVRFLWNEPLVTPDYFPRRTAALASENTIDRFIIHETSREVYELYGKYPIITRIAEKCEVTRFGKRCNGQYFEWQDPDSGEWLRENCSCSRAKFIGAGTEIQVTLPENETALPDVVRLVGADVPTLNFNASRTSEYKEKLYSILAGGNPEGFNNKSINEKQVSGIFEQKREIITKYARQLEAAHGFVLETFARLMFADFESCTVDYGSIFHIETKEYLSNALKDAKEAGAGLGKIITLKEQILNSEAKTMAEVARLKFINMLAEFPEATASELLALRQAGAITNTQLVYNLQLSQLISRYEREQGAITGSENLQTVKQILLSYIVQPQNDLNDGNKDESGQLG